MGINLITDLPAWFSIFCLAAGLLYAWLLYRSSGQDEQFGNKLRKLLFVLRAATVALLCFLLLGPMLRTYLRQVEKPLLIIAMDASSSLLNTRDSLKVKQELMDAVGAIESKTRKEFDVRIYSFGDHARDGLDTSFSDKYTDFTELYNTLDVNYANRNVGAVILASDGLYNQGENPVYGPSRLKVPFYTMALGDTTIRKDLALTRVNHNRVAFIGNRFPLEVILDARQCAGASVSLKVTEDSLEVYNKPLQITGNRFHTEIPVFLDAKKKGIRHYRVTISVLEGEVTAVNNSRDLYIEVVENRQKILLLAAAPHPDLAALKNAIEASPNYEVSIKTEGQPDAPINSFNLVILHGIPSASGNGNSVLKQLEGSSVPVWFVLGANSNVGLFNELRTGLTIQAPLPLKINEVQTVSGPDFTLFTFSENLSRELVNWPPLKSPFGVYTVNGNINTALYQRIGNVSSRQPLFYFSGTTQKIAVTTGEGLWRWKLADYNSTGTDENFREIVSKTIQYLVARENNSPFRVFAPPSFNENEVLLFDAQLLNPAGEPVNEPEATITIVNAEGQKFPYTFSRSGKGYNLNAGQFPSGRYSFTATAKLGEQLYRQQGEFSVNALQLENASTVADHQMLYALSSRTGGKLFMPAESAGIADSLLAREDVRPVSFQERKLSELINLPWVFFLLMLLVSTEWFLRKRSGAY